MRDLKTTLVGAALAGLYVLQDVQLRGASLSDWQTYTIPLAPVGRTTQTHVGLRADSEPSFVSLVQNAQAGIYPPEVPVDLIAPIAAAIIADFSDELWGYDHASVVFETNNLCVIAQN